MVPRLASYPGSSPRFLHGEPGYEANLGYARRQRHSDTGVHDTDVRFISHSPDGAAFALWAHTVLSGERNLSVGYVTPSNLLPHPLSPPPLPVHVIQIQRFGC